MMVNLNVSQRSLIRKLYKKTKGILTLSSLSLFRKIRNFVERNNSFTTIAKELTFKFNVVCPTITVVRTILAEEEEVDERIIRDVFLAQFSPPKSSRERKLSNSFAFSLNNEKARVQSLQNLRNAAILCSRNGLVSQPHVGQNV